MTIKEFMKRYSNDMDLIRQIKERIEIIEAESQNISPDTSGMPHGTDVGDRTGSIAAKLADMKYFLEDKEKESERHKQEIIEVIRGMKTKDRQILLTMKYIDLMTFEEIAKEMYFSNVYVRQKMHRAALIEAQESLDRLESRCDGKSIH